MVVNSFRVALTVVDFDRAVAFYRDGLGLDPGYLWTENGRGQLFGAGEASLEIFDPDYAANVDQIEAGNGSVVKFGLPLKCRIFKWPWIAH
ncbi:MAG: hypothetical protein IPJ90_12295 [Anaerolineaceae bacterium]|nr:hypothetical protein [Anaerolineaceae bacterium]